MSLTFYTIHGKGDGFGAQYQSILSGIAYCSYKGYNYIHTPFSKMDHGVDINKANKFIGIQSKYIIRDISSSIIKKPYIHEVHYSKSPSIYYTDSVLKYIRECYYSTNKPIIENIDIAIHIRRGDIIKDGKHAKRYINNGIYLKIINKLKNLYPDYTITVFSEGNYNDFKDIGLNENCFRLNTDIFETFHSLVSSKILVMGFSSFSYCAAIINTNTVYHYDSFWHKKLDKWLKISDLINL